MYATRLKIPYFHEDREGKPGLFCVTRYFSTSDRTITPGCVHLPVRACLSTILIHDPLPGRNRNRVSVPLSGGQKPTRTIDRDMLLRSNCSPTRHTTGFSSSVPIRSDYLLTTPEAAGGSPILHGCMIKKASP